MCTGNLHPSLIRVRFPEQQNEILETELAPLEGSQTEHMLGSFISKEHVILQFNHTLHTMHRKCLIIKVYPIHSQIQAYPKFMLHEDWFIM